MKPAQSFHRGYTEADLQLVPGLESRGPSLIVRHGLDSMSPCVQAYTTQAVQADPSVVKPVLIPFGATYVLDQDTVVLEGPGGSSTVWTVVVVA